MSDPKELPTPEQDAAVSPIMGHALRRQVLVCTGKSCRANGSEAVLEAFRAQLEEEGLLFSKRNTAGPIQCTECGSVGFCAIGPAVIVHPEGTWYAHVRPEDVAEIVESHLVAGRPVQRLVRKEWPTRP